MFRFLPVLTACRFVMGSVVMGSAVTRWAVLGALLVTAALPLLAQNEAKAPVTSVEARLLEGELLELAEGNAAGALAVYESILASADLTDAICARTLFGIGRAHRKLGELGAAKTRYLELIAKHPGQVKLVQAAHRYVAEIDAGANKLPEFDWAAQVEQNPEIQAQIFEWGMQLVTETSDPVAGNAYRKLLALGATAIPVLEPMLERTRGREHKKNLSLVLIQLGRPEHLPVYVSMFQSTGVGSMPINVPRALTQFTPEVCARGLAVLDQIPASQAGKVATLRIALGDHSQLVEDIVAMTGDFSLLDPLWEDPAKAALLHEALARLGDEDFDRYVEWLGHLLRELPTQVRSEDLAPLLTVTSYRRQFRDFMRRLIELGRFEDVLSLLSAPGAEWFMYYDNSANRGQPRRTPLEWTQYPSPVPTETRALVLRRVNKSTYLLRLALADDAAIPQFVAWVEDHSTQVDPAARETYVARELSQVLEVPSWIQHVSRDNVRLLNEVDQQPVQYSAAFQGALRDLARHPSDPWVRSLALDLLLRRPGDDTRETTRLWDDLAARGAKGELDGATALQVILRGFSDETHVPSDADCAALLACLRSIDTEALLRHPLTFLSGDDYTLVLAMQGIGLNQRSAAHVFMAAVSHRWRDEQIETLFQNLFDVPVISGARQELIGELARATRSNKTATMVTDHLEKFSDLPFVIDWVDGLATNHYRGVSLPVARKLIADRRTPLELREKLLWDLANREYADLATCLDWESLILGDDPVASHVINIFDENAFLTALAARARGAEQGAVRRWAWWTSRGTPASVSALRAALEDPDPSVPPMVRERLFTSQDAEVVPLLHEVAVGGATEDRLRAIDRITEFAELSSVPVMQTLLDDPLLSVKTRALRSLEAMRATRMERERWRRPAKEQGGTPKEGF